MAALPDGGPYPGPGGGGAVPRGTSVGLLCRRRAVRRGPLRHGAGCGHGAGAALPPAVETLYGRSYRMSASRIDRVNTCHFAYFLEYGLRARERTPVGFDAAQVGTFLHYILENVTRESAKGAALPRWGRRS